MTNAAAAVHRRARERGGVAGGGAGAALQASKIKARMYFGIAANDDMRQPDAMLEPGKTVGQRVGYPAGAIDE